MERYKKRFIEIDQETLDNAEQEYNNLIDKLKSNTYRNKEMRIEFAKIIMSLASCQHPLAKKLIWKMGEFANYWQNDQMIDEKEWHKLNNSNVTIDN
jgi:hypothetical protein